MQEYSKRKKILIYTNPDLNYCFDVNYVTRFTVDYRELYRIMFDVIFI